MDPTDLVCVEHPKHGNVWVSGHVKMLLDKDKEETFPQKTPEWYAQRKKYLTASTIGSICGVNRYESRDEAMRNKLDERLDRRSAFTGNKATEHGNRNEPIAIELYEKNTNEKVFAFGLLQSLKVGEEFIAGSPDGITASGRLIEVKCPMYRKPNGTVPEHYMYQVQTLLHILDLKVCDYIEYVPGWDQTLSIVVIVRDDVLWSDTMFPKISKFNQELIERIERNDFPEEKPEKPEPQKKEKKFPGMKCLIQPI